MAQPNFNQLSVKGLKKAIFFYNMDILRRKESHLRTSEDLNIFINPYYKFIALAKFYPIEEFRRQLIGCKTDVSLVLKIIVDLLDDPVSYVLEILHSFRASNPFEQNYMDITIITIDGGDMITKTPRWEKVLIAISGILSNPKFTVHFN